MVTMRTILLLLLISMSFISNGQTIYVNHAATGANNGTSWTDAFTDLQVAITSVNTINNSIWIAAGSYKPATSNRTISFVIDDVGTSLYGGFNGTETMLSERDIEANPTILSGDLSENDDANIAFTNTLRNDNSYNILLINSNDIVLDGFIISDGHANGSGGTANGAAITKAPSVANLTIKNCEFRNNVSYDAAACVLAVFTTTANTFLTVENTIFRNNVSTFATSFYSYTNASTILDITISNSLFDGNKAIDNGATKGYAGSVGWFRAYATSSTVNANFTNNTYVNNVDAGTNTNVVNRATLGLTRRGVASVVLNGNVNNCVFWNNTGIANVASKAVNNIVELLPTIVVNNSLDSDNFSTITAKQNIVTGNPLFVSLTNFNLTSTSPAVNTGNNVYVSSISDLGGNARIVNATVDMGAYEYGDLCNFQVIAITENTANVSWDSAISTDLLYVISGQPLANGTTITGLSTNNTVITGLTQNTYYDLYSSATCSGTNNSGWYLVNTFKTKGAIYVNQAAIGTGDGSSWTNAFTTLDEALLNVTATTNEIRVAQGIYKPNFNGLPNPKMATFAIPNGAKIYGGFNGTEATLAQRDPKINITVLNGDLNGNDNSNIVSTDGSRADNTFHVISLIGQVTGVVIDGFTISGGNANVINSANYNIEGYGGAIYANPGSTIVAKIKNCILEKNSASECGVYGQYSNLSVSNTTVDFENCIIRNNYSAGVSANIYLTGFKNSTSTIITNSSIVNCLFYENVGAGSSNQSASCIATYQNATAGGSYTTVYANIINCTFANNTGISGHALSMFYSSNTSLINSIVYNNGTSTPLYIFPASSVLPTGINNIIQGGALGGDNSNPLFVGSANYELTSTSPAINTGNNTYINFVSTDLNGNARIVSGTVDKGAYEFDPALNSQSFTSFNAFEVYPNPASSLLYISTDDVVETMAVYSLDGKLVVESNENKVDVSNLQNGLYIIKVTTDQNEVGTKKFIKR